MDANVAPRLMTPTPRVLTGDNPFGVPAEFDCVVDRSFGRAPDSRGPATGNMAIRCDQPHRRWTLRFDGAGELTSRDATALGLAGAGAPTPMRFEIAAEAVSPIWDMPASVGLAEMADADAVYAAGHHQQGFTARGELTVGGRRWDVDGVAYRDHSWGPRELSDLGGDAFVSLVFPDSGRVVSGWELWNLAGQVNFRGFYMWEDGRMELISEGSVQRAVDWASNPRTGLVLTLRRASGGVLTLPGEVLNGVTISVLTPNENVNGAAIGADAFIANEDIVRYTWPDGEAGFGHAERSLRASTGATGDTV